MLTSEVHVSAPVADDTIEKYFLDDKQEVDEIASLEAMTGASVRSISSEDALKIRKENARLQQMFPDLLQTARYDALSEMFGCKEWAIRWICQGREHKDAGGPVENILDHEGSGNRSIDNDGLIISIRQRFMDGEPLWKLADEVNVNDVTIARIVLGKTYREIDGPIATKDEWQRLYVSRPVAQVRVSTKRTPKDVKPPVIENRSLVQCISELDSKVDARELSDDEKLLTGMDVFFIRRRHADKIADISKLSKEFNCSEQSIRDIIEGVIFANKPGPVASLVAT